MENTIITIKMSGRPHYIKRTLDGLEKCRGISNYQVILSIDTSAKQNEIKSMINTYEKKGIMNIHSYYASTRLGCAGNMKRCFELAFDENKYEYMFHLEDDTVPSIDYLEFMESTLPMLSDKNIFTVCPYRRKRGLLIEEKDAKDHIGKYTHDKWFECAGGFSISAIEYEKIKDEDGVYGATKSGRTPMGSWALPFAVQYIKNRYCVFPIVNRVVNIGEVGMHLAPGDNYFKRTIYVSWSSNDFDTIDLYKKGYEYVDISDYKKDKGTHK